MLQVNLINLMLNIITLSTHRENSWLHVQQGIASFIYFQGKDKLKSYLSALSFLADENGDFNYADLEANLKKSFEKMGNQYKVPMLSYVFDTQDLNEILQIARGKAHE